MLYEMKFLSVAFVTITNFGEIMSKKGHYNTIDKFLNRL